ncbi:DUF2975 domain-containing protein [Erythrobacter crassostreae]|uniref:DUF2975 domain-containing protein n=1 Tax=Erythrobacter crassostreae TaxID=2828328 RepID=A0A9X1F100_9SPHN|nr:DUF2975 domain-containing protein [Erythrobacter crassostrea]MBV7258327.1 DUF2975 domain-containing protein [Erythrobacter crassostrea]
MQTKPNDVLLLAGKVLTVLMQCFMAIAALAIPIGAAVVVFMSDTINAEIAAEFSGAVGPLPVIPVLGLFALALAAVALIFLFFGRLRAIIETVGEGDPFAPENAERLSFMAWLLLLVQALSIPIAGLALIVAKWTEPMENADVTVDAGIDLVGITMVVVLFILARVFKHGAAMREDLEGTV